MFRHIFKVPLEELLTAYELLPGGFEIVEHGESFLKIAVYTEGETPPELPFEPVSSEKVIQKDWRKFYKPITVGDAVIIPPWEDEKKFEGKTVLVINPGKAFGTGLHESTQLCIALLSELDLNGKTVLDVGCGSGILSIYAAKKGAKRVLAIDIDPMAVEETIKNAEANGVKERIEVLQGGPEAVSESFDLVIANLELPIFKKVLKDITPKAKKEALFSGIYKERELKEFLKMLEEKGLKAKRVEEKNGWYGIYSVKYAEG